MKQRSDDVVFELLPEVVTISGQLQDVVVESIAEDVPNYFWVARSSASYHPSDERGLCGLLLHTKRVYTAYRILERSYRALSAIDAYEANCGRAAVLLHDGFKYGRNPENVVIDEDRRDQDTHEYANGALSQLPAGTDPAHDRKMAQYIRDHSAYPEEVARCVEAHGGSTDWYSHEGPSPRDDLEMLVHTADLIASSDQYRLPVWRPHEEMVSKIGQDVPVLDDDWVLDDG